MHDIFCWQYYISPNGIDQTIQIEIYRALFTLTFTQINGLNLEEKWHEI